MTKHITNINYPFANSWDKDKNHVCFTLEGNNISYALSNSLRRIMIANIDTIGFRTEPHKNNTLNIERNDTVLNNQILYHRLSMIPIHCKKPKEFDWDDYEFILDVENDTNNVKLITTEDFKIKRISTNSFLSRKEVEKLLPPDKLTNRYIPIVKLKPKYYTNVNHSKEVLDNIEKNLNVKNLEKICLKLSGKVVLSNGEENGHFSPVAISAYANTIDEEKAKQGEMEFIQYENENAMANNLSLIDEEKLKNRFKISKRERFFKVDENGEPNSFDFKVESIGVIPPLVVLSKSIEILVKKLTNFISNLQTKNEDNIQIIPSTTILNGFEIIVLEENDTLGNVLQTYLNNMFASYSLPKEERKLISVNYYRTHPLEKKIILGIKPINNNFDECISGTIIPGVKKIIEICSKLLQELRNKKEFLDELKTLK